MSSSKMPFVCAIVVSLACSTAIRITSANDANTVQWSQFRGPNAAGIAAEHSNIPTTFGKNKNLVWQLPLPTGASSPCVWGDRIFVTGYDQDEKQLKVYCVNRNDGTIQWQRVVPAKQIERTHSSSTPASATPAADDERVYFYFGSFGLLCCDHAGEQLWSIEQPVPQTRNGSGTSPVVVGELLVLNREEANDSYLLAVDRKTGETVWKHKHTFPPGILFEGYATPVIWNDQVILHTHSGIRAFDVHRGRLAWQVNTVTTGCSTPVIGQGHLYVATWNNLGEPDLRPEYPSFDELLVHDSDQSKTIGFDEFPRDVVVFQRPEASDEQGVALPMRVMLRNWDANQDRQIDETEWKVALDRINAFISDHGLLAIKLGGTGDVTKSHVRVFEKRAIPEVPSPLYHGGRVYMIKRGGIVTCFEADTGKRLYRKRLAATGSYYASPIAIGDRIFFTSARGEVTVIRAGDQLEVLAVNDLEERTLATPAVADGELYIRTNQHLYAFKQ